MPRMFEILKTRSESNDKNGQKEKPLLVNSLDKTENNKNHKITPLSFPREILKTTIPTDAGRKDKKQEEHSLMSEKLLSALKKYGADDHKKSKETYDSTVETINGLLMKIRLREDLSTYMDKLYELLDNIFNQLVLGNSLLDNIYERKKEKYYLPYHIVNVLILSTVLGLNMGFNKSRLSHLGLASIFCDLGMDALREIANQPRALNKEEHDLIKTHVFKSLEIIKKIGVVNDIVKETIELHHERVSGNGYPCGVKSDKINPYAKILGLVDTYEALTNTRPYREVTNTHNVVKFIIDSLKNDFDTEVMKMFINKMSVYPVGSIVKLDTEELARVIGVQPGFPLRPVIMIIRDSNGEPVKKRVVIDLSKQDFPLIKNSI